MTPLFNSLRENFNQKISFAGDQWNIMSQQDVLVSERLATVSENLSLFVRDQSYDQDSFINEIPVLSHLNHVQAGVVSIGISMAGGGVSTLAKMLERNVHGASEVILAYQNGGAEYAAETYINEVASAYSDAASFMLDGLIGTATSLAEAGSTLGTGLSQGTIWDRRLADVVYEVGYPVISVAMMAEGASLAVRGGIAGAGASASLLDSLPIAPAGLTGGLQPAIAGAPVLAGSLAAPVGAVVGSAPGGTLMAMSSRVKRPRDTAPDLSEMEQNFWKEIKGLDEAALTERAEQLCKKIKKQGLTFEASAETLALRRAFKAKNISPPDALTASTSSKIVHLVEGTRLSEPNPILVGQPRGARITSKGDIVPERAKGYQPPSSAYEDAVLNDMEGK